jgi:hypothetical protein
MVMHPPRASLLCRRVSALVGMLLLVVSALILGATAASAAPKPRASPTSAAGQVTWVAAPANTALGKDRAHYAYSLAPGSTVTDAIAVVNRSDTSIKLRVYASDAFSTATGGIDLLPANKKPTDVGSWIAMKQSVITVAPQKSAIVPFTITVPEKATPGDHSGGVVTSLVTGDGSSAVQLDRRLGSRLYLRVTGDLAPALTVTDVQAEFHGTLNPAAGGSTTVDYTVTNTGNVRLKAHQTVRIASVFGAFAYDSTLADLPEILPGDSLKRSATVSGVLPATRMTATVTLAPVASGDQPPINVQKAIGGSTIWAWPWGQLIVLVILVALVYGYVQMRRRRKFAVAAAIAAAVSAAQGDSNDRDGEAKVSVD